MVIYPIKNPLSNFIMPFLADMLAIGKKHILILSSLFSNKFQILEMC